MTKHLCRSTTNRMIAGVCGGLGEYFNIDPTIVRVFFVILAFAQGIGVLVYAVMWIMIPEKSGEAAVHASTLNTEPIEKVIRETFKQEPRTAAGLVLVILGVLFLLSNFFPALGFYHLWPLLLVILGAMMLLRPPKSPK